MAESFEPYHVPQQSRRDKLRGLALPDNLVSLYHDPSINIPSSDHFPTYYMDPQDINTNPFLYSPQNLKYLDDTCNINTNNAHQGLSLSLSSIHHTSNGSTSNNYLSKSNTTCHVPLGPFTGYSLILKRSRFLKPAQMLLEELCDVGSKGIFAEKLADDESTLLLDSPLGVEPQIINGDEHVMRKKSRLISMLDEVYQKYKQYYQQQQMVVASFESAAGLGNAAPFANLALKAMSKNFKCLKDAITDQLQFTSKSHSPVNCERVKVTGKELYCQRRAIHSAGFADRTQPVWRPQRGLPERAVTVLRAWLFDHFLHPYPTDTDKVMLAKQTGLSRNQVSNWFINARVRLWKPMVEEIHMLETREGHNKTSQIDQGQNSNNNPIEHFPTSSNSHPCDQTPSTSAPRIQDIPSKRTRNDLANIPLGSNMTDSINLSYGNLSTGTGGVSLTLGLHQNTGNIGLSEPFPINAARRFGIDSNSDHRFMVSGFEEQNGQFGRNMISGQFLQDFAS